MCIAPSDLLNKLITVDNFEPNLSLQDSSSKRAREEKKAQNNCLGRPVHITDARSNASAYRDVRAYALGDLRADEGDDGRAILRADHGHLRSIVDADGYGRAELYAVGHKRADQVRRIRPPLHLSV